MSGGSFDYLCFKFEPQIDEGAFSWSTLHSLEAMADSAAVEGYHDMAVALNNLKANIRIAMARIEGYTPVEFREVMRAYEWWHSGDISKDRFEEVLAVWRGK